MVHREYYSLPGLEKVQFFVVDPRETYVLHPSAALLVLTNFIFAAGAGKSVLTYVILWVVCAE